MIRPPYLKTGSTVGIAAPGRKISKTQIESAVKILESWGLVVRLSKNLFAGNHSYFSGTDEERLSDLQQMMDDPITDVIIAARGGYGTSRILDRVNLDQFQQHPKWIVGFSDVTALHLKLFKTGFESIHGTMPILFSDSSSASSIASLKSVLMGGKTELIVPADRLNVMGKANGQLIGGNLSLLVDSLGTATELDTTGKILVLEDTDEYLYRVDRMLNQLKRAGKLKALAGLIIGHFTDMHDTDPKFGTTTPEIIREQVKEFNYPLAFGFPIGHVNPNLAWRHGAEATLEVSSTGSRLMQV